MKKVVLKVDLGGHEDREREAVKILTAAGMSGQELARYVLMPPAAQEKSAKDAMDDTGAALFDQLRLGGDSPRVAFAFAIMVCGRKE